MIHASRALRASMLLFICGALTTACADNEPDTVIVVPAPTGLLTVEYSIEGSISPALCAFYGASDFELVLYDTAGRASYHYAPCEDFTISVEAPEGAYYADATLVDIFLDPVSVTATLDDLRLIEGTELVVAVDFPTGSFL